ncbi:MAG: glycosyltransferase family 61 protein [Pseudomonadota bacterium]
MMKFPVLTLDEYISKFPEKVERIDVLPARRQPVARPFCFSGTTDLQAQNTYFPESLDIPALDIVTLRNATVVGAGLVITEDGFALLCHETLPLMHLGGIGRVSAKFNREERTLSFERPIEIESHIKKTAALLGRPGTAVYFHLMIDILPRLYALEIAKEYPDTLLLLHNTPAYFRNLLAQATAYGQDKHTLYTGQKGIKVDRLIVPRLLFRMDHWVYPELSLYLRKIGERLIGKSDFGTLPRKIYSIRREMKSDRRRMLNANAIAQVMEDAGFVEIPSGKLSMAQQAAVFMNADCLAMSIGGHNANIAFVKPGAKVLYTFADYDFNYTAPSYLAIGAGADCGFTFGAALLNPHRRQHVEFLAHVDATKEALKWMA